MTPIHRTRRSDLATRAASAAAATAGDVLEQPDVETSDERYVRALLPHLDLATSPARISLTARFREIVSTLGDASAATPAGFRIERRTLQDGTLELDLVRDISCQRNGQPRPTPLIFSIDTANPYEAAPLAPFVGNLTCNPGIVYDLFLNDPAANVGRAFGSLEDVLGELAQILGAGCDISVQLHDPFDDFDRILDEVQRYEAILTRHRLVVKVPHTGPLNPANVGALLTDPGRLAVRWDEGAPADMLRGHELALRLHDHGYRVNFTLMFEPYQTPLALQARPYFINAFIRHRHKATRIIAGLLAAYDATEEIDFIEQLRDYLVAADYLRADEHDLDLLHVIQRARAHLRHRHHNHEGADGLDSARHSLRWLKTSNLPETRLILCSMEGQLAFPDVMAMLLEPEFRDLHHRVLLSTEPRYLARWTSSPHVVSYQRRFMRATQAVNGR